MHAAVREWVGTYAPTGPVTVIECGSRDINGGVRDLFDEAATYVGVDIADGPGVSVVSDWLDYHAHWAEVDVVVHCEVAEHTSLWPAHLYHASNILKLGGVLIFTAAGPGRAPHSAIDEAPIRDFEHYENVTPDALAQVLTEAFSEHIIDVQGADIRAWARK